jgi:hypothetical protein
MRPAAFTMVTSGEDEPALRLWPCGESISA